MLVLFACCIIYQYVLLQSIEPPTTLIRDANIITSNKYYSRRSIKEEKAGLAVDPPLPQKVISIFGPESSGTTFLWETLSVAVGAIDNVKQLKHDGKQLKTADGEWEIQHLSLPWGWNCDEENYTLPVVEALVPQECFRYELDPSILPGKAQAYFWTLRELRKKKSKMRGQNNKVPSPPAAYYNDTNSKQCRDAAYISEKKDGWSCGATCGVGKYSGYALYPLRFFVNITSHIEWYLKRGVDIKVVLSLRDRTISKRGKKGHCKLPNIGTKEDDLALRLMSDAIRAYGLEPGGGRVLTVSYEGLMELKSIYLHDLYHDLGISSSSTHIPLFKDGNVKHIK